MKQKILAEIRQLPIDEKISLIEELIAEVTETFCEQQFTDEEPEGLAVRHRELDKYFHKSANTTIN